MSFLKNMFKRKPGGTFVGNLIRGVANKASGGALGNGALMISQQEYDLKNLSDSDFEQKYGQRKTNAKSLNPINPNIQTVEQQLQTISANQTESAIKSSSLSMAKEKLKKYWYVLLLPFGLIIYTLIGKKRKSTYKRKY